MLADLLHGEERKAEAAGLKHNMSSQKCLVRGSLDQLVRNSRGHEVTVGECFIYGGDQIGHHS